VSRYPLSSALALLIALTVLLTLLLDRRSVETLGAERAGVVALVFGGILVGFIAHERRAASPMVNLALFRIRMFTFSVLSLLLIATTISVMSFLMPFYIQDVLGFSPSFMGLLFLSHYAESHYLMRILEIGTDAIGYRLKEKVGSVEALSDTLARIEAGEIVIEPVLAKRLVDRPGAQRKDAVATLSERELDVLRLMAEGRSNGGIAAQLFVSAKAVEKHIASIFTKLDLHPDASVNHRRVLAVLRYLRSQRDED